MPLQWGRGLKTPEKPTPPSPKPAPTSSFNGAGVLRPRKIHSGACRRGRTVELQWGRGLKTPENGAGFDAACMLGHASMGPGS